MAFRGWPAGALTFYVGLEADNSKAYWLAHKQVYDDVGESAVPRALAPRREGVRRRSICSGPNRDTRFAKDKSPYKTAAAAVTESEGGAAYYVQISARGSVRR